MTTQEPPEHPTDLREGTWSRLELLQMNARFVAAMECALDQEGQRSKLSAQGVSEDSRLGGRTSAGMKNRAA